MTFHASPAPEEADGPVYAGFRLQNRGLVPVDNPSREDWLRCLDHLVNIERHVHFWLGDLLAFGEQQRWVTYGDLAESTGYDAGTLRNLKWVASRVAPDQRRPELPYAHHQEVARLPPEQQETVLADAEAGGWTSKAVRQEAYRRAAETSEPPVTTVADPCLRLGDCRDVLAGLPDGSVDLLLTDPPYGLSYVSPARTLPFDPIANDDGDEAFDILEGALSAVVPKMKPDSHAYVFSCWKTFRPMAEVVRRHFTLANVLVWEKNSWGVGDLEGAYGDQQELVLFATRGRRPLNGVPQSNVLPFNRVGTCQLQHPTQKPVDLLAYLIARSTYERGVVADPFMGSGSTCVAARNTRRRYLGVELDPQWYDLALRRLADPNEEG